MIHVCFSIQDNTGSYSKFTGTAMLSLFENIISPPEYSITVHILHDDTLTQDNREKFIQIANRHKQLLKFYNVEELCVEKFAKINEYFSDVEESRFSIAMFYRLFIPDLLPPDVEKTIYLDSDIIVNLDISELWQIELGDKPLGAVPNLFQMKDEQASNNRTIKIIPSVGQGLINAEDYFNSGVLLMNLKVLCNQEAKILEGIKFRGEHPELRYYDQEIFNYCFSTAYLRLPVKFNRYVMLARSENEWTVEKKIYHYAGNKVGLGPNMNDPFNHLWMDYFTRTPWFDVDKLVDLPGGILYPYAISVIIPLYNAEKYFGECLDSILAQTFKDFELVIVDDCSTDSSCEIVESYMPKFNGRLKLYHTEKNTGSGVVARNIGLSKAKGEYIYNMDNDDVITKTALEEMYSLAKKYDADVVYCERYYMSTGVGEEFIKDIHLATTKIQNPPYVNEPTLESKDLSERVQKIVASRFYVAPWLKLVRHDLLDKHKISFPVLKIGDDDIWTYALVFFAKKFLRVPNKIYIRRMREDSITGIEKNPQQMLDFWLNPVLLGLKELDNFMSQIDFFKENPQQRYYVLKKFSDWKLSNTFKTVKLLAQADVYEAIRNEFGKKLGEYDVLISALCACIFEQQKNVLVNLEQTNQIKENQKLLAEKDVEINRLRSALAFQTSLLPQVSYAISVIIPLYNADEFVGQCLESLLIQTFQDFEVIVVDDCSTDNSVAIVESYRPKFNGRLKLTKTEKNSGGGGYVPRNIGFKLASGKYVYFMDADDFLLGTALEIFCTTAEKHAVDVIYTSVRYNLTRPNDIRVSRDNKERFVSKVLEGEEIDKFLHGLFFEDNFSQPWVYFVRREFLIQNNITFPEIMKAGDYLWAVNICCQTKKIFRLAKPLYLYNQYNTKSVSRRGSSSISHSKWISAFTDFIKALNEMARKVKFLNNNPSCVYGIAGRYFKVISKNIAETKKSLSDQEIFETLYYDDRSDLMIPFFFNTINNKQKELTDIEGVFRKFRPHIFVRIDVKLPSTKGDLQIISLSDDKAEFSRPFFLNKNGIGYVIQSCVGTLNFIAKSTVDGQIQLALRGIDVRAPKENSKHIPYWIDYTKLTVNGEIIFDTITPTWHDKPYRYNLDVKADEEIKIEVEWLPHRDDRTDLSVDTTKELEKNDETLRKSEALVAELRTALDNEKKSASKQNSLIAELRAALDSEKKTADKQNALVSELRTALETEKEVHSDDVELIRKFSNYFTARLDFKLALTGEGDFQIVSVSDEKALVKKITRWLSANETGYSVQSYVGKMEIVGKVIGGGQFNLNLKGMDVRDPQNQRKRIPYWIDYTKLTVNGEIIFDSITPVWHDKPYSYVLDVKADEEIKIEVEWLPHSDKQSEEQDVQVAKKLEEQNVLISELQTALDSERKSAGEKNSLVSELRMALDNEKKAAGKRNALVSELRTALDNEKKSADEQNALISELRTELDNEKKAHSDDVELIRKFSNYFTARLDFKLMPSGEGDFQIVFVSDEKAAVKKARWLSANEVGYSVQSYVGKMEIVGKVIGGGQFNLNLKGKDVRDPQNRRKRIPYWIDYTKLTVNGEIIFDSITPVWHDKPYSYALDVKADEEIKIEVEWLPHSDKQSEEQNVQVAKKLEEQNVLISELQTALDSERKSAGEKNSLVSELRMALDNEKKAAGKRNALVSELRTALDNEKKSADEQNALISELRTELDNEKKAHSDDVELIRKFSNYFTARLDFKLMPSGEGDFQIVSVSDEKALVKKVTRGLSANEVGYSVQSYIGKMEIIGKVTGGGQFNLNLKGKDVRDPQNKKKRIPYWIDYTNLTVNGEVILDKVASVWHNEPYNYIFYAKADEEIRIEVEWLPHNSDN